MNHRLIVAALTGVLALTGAAIAQQSQPQQITGTIDSYFVIHGDDQTDNQLIVRIVPDDARSPSDDVFVVLGDPKNIDPEKIQSGLDVRVSGRPDVLGRYEIFLARNWDSINPAKVSQRLEKRSDRGPASEDEARDLSGRVNVAEISERLQRMQAGDQARAPRAGQRATQRQAQQQAQATGPESIRQNMQRRAAAERQRWLPQQDTEHEAASEPNQSQRDRQKAREKRQRNQPQQQPVSVRGTVEAVKDFQISGIDAQHRLIKVRSERTGKTWVVDLGETNRVAQLGIEKGDRVMVQGEPARINDRPVLRASQLAQVVALNRQTDQRAEQQRQRQQRTR